MDWNNTVTQLRVPEPSGTKPISHGGTAVSNEDSGKVTMHGAPQLSLKELRQNRSETYSLVSVRFKGLIKAVELQYACCCT